MKRKFISTVVAAFTFIAMMSVTAFASPVATVRLEADAIDDGQVEVGVYVDATAPGVSALVVDINYTGVQRLAPEQRQFTTSDGTNVFPQPVSVTGGIEMGPAFGMTFDQFISPPADGALRLYFEMAEDGVLTGSGRAATITFNVPEGVKSGSVTPVIHTVPGEGGRLHQFAYRWTTEPPYFVHLGDTVEAGPTARIGDGLANIPGDVNLSGETDEADLIRMRQYFARFPVEVCRINGDVNGDGEFDEADLIRMRQFFARFPVELEPYASRVN